MKKLLMTLTVLLVFQLGLGAGIYFSEQAPIQGNGQEKLIATDPSQVTELQIYAADQNLVLKKTDSGWMISGQEKVPVDAAKVDTLLDKLSALDRPWPVAKSAGTYKRFKVADDDFERKLVLRHGETDLATVLIGSSPGFRKVHARLAGEDNIYDVPFSSYEASLKVADWLDKKALWVDPAKVEGIELPGVLLVKKEDTVQLDGLQAGEQTDQEKVSKLVQDLAGLQVQGVHDGPQGDQAVTIPVILTLADGKTLSYTFAKSEKDDYALLRADGSGPLYEINQALWTEISNLKRTDLITVQTVSQKSQAAPSAKDTN